VTYAYNIIYKLNQVDRIFCRGAQWSFLKFHTSFYEAARFSGQTHAGAEAIVGVSQSPVNFELVKLFCLGGWSLQVLKHQYYQLYIGF
jgi:hypothetical protein